MKKFYLFFIVVLCTVTGNAQTADSAYQDGVASFKVRVDSSTEFPPYPYEGIYPVMDSLITKYGITSITKQFPASENPHLAGMYFVKFDSIYAANLLIADLQQYTFMEFACKMPINKPFSTPNDTKHSFQWALKKIMTDSIWHLLPGDGKRIKIAVIDDAILLSHEDLKGVIDTNYTELLGVSTVDDDYNGRFLTIDDSIGYDIADQDNNVNPPRHSHRYLFQPRHTCSRYCCWSYQ